MYTLNTHIHRKCLFPWELYVIPIRSECVLPYTVFISHTTPYLGGSWCWSFSLAGFCCFWRQFMLVVLQSSCEGAISGLHPPHGRREVVLCSDLSASWHTSSWLSLSKQSWVWCVLSAIPMVSMVNATCQTELPYLLRQEPRHHLLIFPDIHPLQPSIHFLSC